MTESPTIADNLDELLAVLPADLVDVLDDSARRELVEVVLDLGREPMARTESASVRLRTAPVTREDIEHVVGRVGDFGADNRAGIERTLHRISAMRNRRGDIVGITCRVGRAVSGTIEMIRDLVETGQSLLLLGRPGIGKTTKLREVARVLSDDFGKRVIVVDTSNEIAGDGDIPHPAIGQARRMQVPRPELQHDVMIEAVENHMPEVVVIDEIGRTEEAYAARTIAERGVQLVATAHGNSLDNILMNPTLSDLVGGIQSVVLSDEEAKRRATRKTVLERRAPPTFDVVVEMVERSDLVVHADVALAVDSLLAGEPSPAERRWMDENGAPQRTAIVYGADESVSTGAADSAEHPVIRSVYPIGISHNRLARAINAVGAPIRIARHLEHADAVLTVKSQMRDGGAKFQAVHARGAPVFVVRSNTYSQILSRLREMVAPRHASGPSLRRALEEAAQAITTVVETHRPVDLTPVAAPLRRRQHELVEGSNLRSYSVGHEPHRRVRVVPE